MEGTAHRKGCDRAPRDPPYSDLADVSPLVADGCFNAIFEGTVLTLHQAELLDVSIIHGDGTTTAAKKGGDNIGFNGHKKIKGDKVVAFCDRNCNVIAPFISAPGNQNESPLLRDALPEVTRIAGAIGLDLRGTIVGSVAAFRRSPDRVDAVG